MIKTNNIELWEIMKDGKHGEIFEVSECILSSYIGQQLMVEEKTDYRGKYKALIEASKKGDSSEQALFKLYGCLGTAKFKKVQDYQEIDYAEALKMLGDYRVVYYLKDGNYMELSRYTDFSELDLVDFDDLFIRSFYKKGDK